MQRRIIRLAGVAILCLMTGCSPRFKDATTDNTSTAPHIHRREELEQKTGRVITLEGIAVNMKAGAALLLDSTTRIYIEDREAWPSSVQGAHVQVTGTMAKHAGVHDPRVGGIQDDYYTIRP
jgi:hypothetical protein